MNKLHTISGLIQLEEYDEALQFISNVAKNRNNISSILTKKIKDPSLSAILFSKYNKAEENRIKFNIDESSNISKLPKFIDSEDIVSIVGNLIENSLDEVNNDGSGEVYIKIVQQSEFIEIKISDNGPGIREEYIDKVYEQGFTTKEGQRGHGMYIVKKIIDRVNGKMELKVNNGVNWNIIIPMEECD
ncbi:ATP-binding protein [Paraclostridium bifermentans]|uniref:histidine kinase n=1 Tax=Paraclostridium bifermentans TaxID=1490 RepID=A0ABY8R597_PARBF|nr:ATP-binding protein [Paraclostridium bifermentans]